VSGVDHSGHPMGSPSQIDENEPIIQYRLGDEVEYDICQLREKRSHVEKTIRSIISQHDSEVIQELSSQLRIIDSEIFQLNSELKLIRSRHRQLFLIVFLIFVIIWSFWVLMDWRSPTTWLTMQQQIWRLYYHGYEHNHEQADTRLPTPSAGLYETPL